ncbi:hypothetical protein GCM10010249_33850 [Streptomyces roseolilacinus]|uniref:Uncharacterized protein n=1 Tax=Streptomyces roseolilacinus TaxID=66904 RepID=A0A918EL96_9ACTN|nr:hypothetical protein GCM10010249_33850 [Streptomyces roseolilacinus]
MRTPIKVKIWLAMMDNVPSEGAAGRGPEGQAKPSLGGHDLELGARDGRDDEDDDCVGRLVSV